MTSVAFLTLYYEVLCNECFTALQRLQEAASAYGERARLKYNACSQVPIPDEVKSIIRRTDSSELEFMGFKVSFDQPPEDTIALPEMAKATFANQRMLRPLRGLKAAEFQSGAESHARLLDCLHRAHFGESRNIAIPDTIFACATKIGLDMERFRGDFESEASLAAVLSDWFEAQKIGISRVPTVMFGDRRAVTGVVSADVYRRMIDDMLTDFPSED
jgi:predicted DsbA family dithiol-disulfide isomerase